MGSTLPGQLLQRLLRAERRVLDLGRVLVAQVEGTALDDLQCARHGIGLASKQARHFLRRTRAAIGAALAPEPDIIDGAALADAGTDLHFGFPTDGRHRNLRGVLRGVALMTFADRAMGITARAAKQATRSATIQLDVHFADAVRLGEFVETQPRVIRATRQLVFMSALLTVADRVVASANGIWKILDSAARRPGH